MKENTMAEDSRVIYYWGPLLQCKPYITSRAKYLITALESTIKVFCTTTGSLLTTLVKHEEEIIGFVPYGNLEDHFISCDRGGKICLWDLRKEVKGISSLVAECSLNRLEGTTGSKVISFMSRGDQKEVFFGHYETRHIGDVDRKRNVMSYIHYKNPFGQNPFKVYTQPMHAIPGLVSNNGKHLAWCTYGVLCVRDLDELTEVRHQFTGFSISCVACHPSESIVATGTRRGQILVWYNLFGDVVKHEFHWHSAPVADLAFSSTGTDVYSVGDESVLVKYEFVTGTKKFIPRLGMSMKYVVTDAMNQKVVCAHKDSAFSILSAKDFRLEGVIQGISLNTDKEVPYPAGILYDPRTKCVVLNGKSGHLQFYDLHHNKLLYQMDIVCQNYINDEVGQKIYNIELERAAVSPNGSWLATFEYRNDEQSSLEIRMKFWNFNEQRQSWALKTVVEMPHRKYINQLFFDPSSKSPETDLCVSCSDDGKFKVWELMDMSDSEYNKHYEWRCRNIGFYRHLPATAVTISPDGSLIAAGFSNILTIWKSDQCHLKGTLSQSYLKDTIKQIEFGRTESCSTMVVTRSDNWVCGWNLFTCSLSWRLMVRSTCMAVDPISSFMAVFSEKGDAIIFEPESTLQLTRLENIIKDPAMCAAFVPRLQRHSSSMHWNEESKLFIIDKEVRLKLIEPMGDIYAAEAALREVVQELEEDNVKQPAPTPLQSLVAQTRVSDVVPEKNAQTGTAKWGVDVQSSTTLLKTVLDEARVYRLDAFTSLSKEFCNLVLPESVTSEEKNQMMDIEILSEKQGSIAANRQDKTYRLAETAKPNQESGRKKPKGEKKKSLKRAVNSDFGDLLKKLAYL